MEIVRNAESQSDSNSALASLRCSATRFPFSVKETVRLTGRNGSEVNVTSISSAIRSITLVLDCGFGMIVSKSVIYGDESDSKRRIKIPTAPRSSNTLSGMIIAVLDIEMQYISINLYLHHIIAICNYKILYTLDYIMQLQNIIKAASESENAARQNQETASHSDYFGERVGDVEYWGWFPMASPNYILQQRRLILKN